MHAFAPALQAFAMLCVLSHLLCHCFACFCPCFACFRAVLRALPLLCVLLPMLCVLSGSFACFATALRAFARTWQSRQGTTAMLADKTLQRSVAAHAQRGGIGIDHRPCFRAYGRIERHALCIRLLSAGSCPFSSPAVFLFTHNFVPLRQITPNGAVLGTPPLGFT